MSKSIQIKAGTTRQETAHNAVAFQGSFVEEDDDVSG